MVETDWKEILSFSQRELSLDDKEKLCESLCWMEADDIELNFTDLKTLFRLAQDILKLKSEQVNNLDGQLKATQRKTSKTKIESPYAVSPTQSNDSALETITHQEEIIRANKEILEQLYADIADLESRKSKLEESRSNRDIDSESSRDVLSEMNEVAELEQEVTKKNKHIRKLLTDVKILEDENTKLKEKVSILKEKLTEATQIISSLTEQMVTINNECGQLKDILGQSEQQKAQLSVDIENLKKELSEKDYKTVNVYQELKSKVQHWKNVAKAKKTEAEALSNENLQLKEDLLQTTKPSLITSPKKNDAEREKIKELQDKLIEASTEIEETANLIDMLRTENRQLKALIEEIPDGSTSERKNESDDGKERAIITKLRKKIKTLTASLQAAEEMIAAREKELLEITSQLQLIQSDEGINTLLEGLKSKKRQLKLKEEGIKNLVQETNNLNQRVNDLQLENETLRRKLNIPLDEKIQTKGIMREYYDLKNKNSEIRKELKKLENKLVELGLNNHILKSQVSNFSKFLIQEGHTKDKIKEIAQAEDAEYLTTKDNTEETTRKKSSPINKQSKCDDIENLEKEMFVLIEENKGLRKGLQEMLDFLKDNSTTSSGVLTLQCPSLESILLSMEARNTAGWFAPHMTTVMELRAALGGKDALLIALHEARKETFDVMAQLNEETKKTSKLEQKLNEMELINKQKEEDEKRLEINADVCEFGTWISDKEQSNINFHDQSEIENLTQKGTSLYECQLKKGLEYFHHKFKDLFDKLTTMTIQMSDNRNSWSIQEEHYKAEIENLKCQIQQDDDDFSDLSPGMIPVTNTNSLQRKCSYLEEAYRHIRTLNENMKNEILETKKDAMVATSDHENRIQKLILSVANLTDKLRYSISYDLFWKQNLALNEVTSKYRKLLENNMSSKYNSESILKCLEDSKTDIINRIQREFHVQNGNTTSTAPKIESNIEALVLHKQLEQLSSVIKEKDNEIDKLHLKIAELQETQGKIIDESLASMTKEDISLMKEQLEKITDDNKILQEQCQHTTSQLDIALLQLQDTQQRQMSRDIEINMLEHQILDLQSTSDSKAIMSRLSGEILIAHLQASESYKRIERLSLALNKEKLAREEAEEMLRARQKIFDVYALRYESKFRYIFDVMQTLRHQYQGCIPRASIENYLNEIEELSRKNHDVDEKLTEVDDLRSRLIAKHSIFDQILDVSKDKCLIEEDSCPHKLKYIVTQSINSRELEHTNKKLKTLEQSRDDIIKHCNNLERTLVLVNQGFEKSNVKHNLKIDNGDNQQRIEVHNLMLEDIQSDEESDSSGGSKTITLSKPQILKQPQSMTKPQDDIVETVKDSPIRIKPQSPKRTFADVSMQTTPKKVKKINQLTQTDEYKAINEMKTRMDNLQTVLDRKSKELTEAMVLIQKRSEENLKLNKEKIGFEYSIENLKDSSTKKDSLIEKLRSTIDELRRQVDELKIVQKTESNRIKDDMHEENKSLLLALQHLENDKKAIETEYKELLNNERAEYTKSVKELHTQLMEVQSKLDRRGSESNISNGEAFKEIVTKYTMKIAELEDKSFKLQSELDECKSELTNYQSEAERWKDLAAERLTKMEQLNLQLEERHCQEVKSYKAENQHWLSQINDMQREHLDLRTRLTDQKTAYIKQLADKDSQIEQLRVVINNLKTQVMNMQTLISVNDPSFDLSAIVEVDETNDVLSQHGSDRLELKFDSTVDFHESQDEIVRIPASSTTIWQEPVIERLRREKQMASKQNAILRRQIKVLAARERRARLDAQNLKSQVFRINTNGNKVTSSETAGLHNKIASLQAQLTSARRDTHSSIALWDKWKRSQQAADRWQARYEEKHQEVLKLEASLHLAKSAIGRLEKEKRILLTRLNEAKSENQLTAIEKQEAESPEKSHRSSREGAYSTPSLPVSSQALLDRVEAQQRRIAALEVAEKGNELLVSEYEKSLAEITSLKGQVLKLESTLLESQIRTPMKSSGDTQPELEYWKNYCQMLKEENVQLTHKINSMETLPTTAHQHRVNDLEQTVLTLRGVINKLQAEQKSGVVYKRVDSRPNSSRSVTEKGRIQLESHRVEIVNLKRTIHDKDLLLERSKEMLKIAAEREDELLRENTYLRRQMDELTRPNGGFLSA
ncbi:unnamed protein product [Arctia plantaginis]|uniref:Centrosomal protein of 290 kDa n=1 Tax=Arctia plantaginis TaxID=874455 RepID=A0A8S0ZUW1_ARCPL|nr:unnamed protein product [Arctia plantaginis]